MFKIAHRGNISGPSERENQPAYIREAIAKGYEVEVDVWLIGDELWLGHDMPQYLLLPETFAAIAEHTWFHCKNVAALGYFNQDLWHLKYFWHENDRYTLTSTGQIWVYPGQKVPGQAIVVDLDLSKLDTYKDGAYAVCTDYPEKL